MSLRNLLIVVALLVPSMGNAGQSLTVTGEKAASIVGALVQSGFSIEFEDASRAFVGTKDLTCIRRSNAPLDVENEMFLVPQRNCTIMVNDTPLKVSESNGLMTALTDAGVELESAMGGKSGLVLKTLSCSIFVNQSSLTKRFSCEIVVD